MQCRADPGLALLLERAGGVSALARYLGVSAQAVALWTQVPEKYVVRFASEFRIGRYRLRPDLFDGRGRRRSEPSAQPTP